MAAGGFTWAEPTLQDTGQRAGGLLDAHGKPMGEGQPVMELRPSQALRTAVQMGVLGAFAVRVRPHYKRFKHRWWVWR